MEKDDKYYLEKAINEAKKAYQKNEIPVGVIIVIDNKIISRAHNLRDSTNIVTKHAEIIAIEKANKKINNWRLNNAKLYTTLEPCNMCKEVLKEARVTQVIYGAKNINSSESIDFIQINDKNLIDMCENLIKNKFNEIRKR